MTVSKKDRIGRIKQNFPKDLLSLDQWVVWKIIAREGKPTKVPFSVGGSLAASDNPATWSSFDAACKAYLNGNYNGVGFMFSEHDPYCGVDFDKCVESSGISQHDISIDQQRFDWMHRLNSYSEYSQSGTGIHTIVIGTLPPEGRKSTTHNVEMYDRVRFFVVTGDHIPNTPATIEHRQNELTALHAELFPRAPARLQPTQHANTESIHQDDQELLRRAFSSRNGAAIEALWRGDTSAYNGDESAADLALCNHLAFYTGRNAARMDGLFRQSGLFREKWDRNARHGETYGQGTIARAISITTEVYQPTAHRNGNGQHGEPTLLNRVAEAEVKAEKPATAAPDASVVSAPPEPRSNNFLLNYPISDEGNAGCVLALHGNRFLHSESLGWLYYDGRKWITDEAEAAVDRAIVTMLEERIKAALSTGNIENYAALIKFCVPNSGRVTGCRNLLQSKVSAGYKTFDNDPDLLNCNNGVVDLRTGEISPHSSEQRFTYCVAVDYDPTCPTNDWDEWLLDAVGDYESYRYMQLSVGYSLTGHTSEEVLFYLYGPPRSGKGTFTEVMLSLMGQPVAKEVDFGIFTAKRTGDSQNFDLAPLRPCRFVAASESNQYERFNEAKVKALTGGNEIYCAFKHKGHFNYRPQFKIWLSSNHTVNADPDDDAVWGRIRVIEFPNSHLGDEDKSLKYRMKSPATLKSVLAWAVQGAIEWYKLGQKGLPEIEQSKATKKLHRDEIDTIQNFIDECCIIGSDFFIANDKLFPRYESWCEINGVEPKKQKGLTQALNKKGFVAISRKINGITKRGLVGIGLQIDTK